MSETTGLAAASPSDIAAAAERLAGAAASGVPCAPVRNLIGRNDLAAGDTVTLSGLGTVTARFTEGTAP